MDSPFLREYRPSMKSFCLLVLAGFLAFSHAHAADATADAAWADILKSAKPPIPPAEWNQKAPTPEQMAEFKKKAGDIAEQVAEKTKKFYEAYPDHSKAAEARTREKTFRQQAASLRGAKEAPKAAPAGPGEPEMDPAFKAKYLEAIARIRALRADGPPAVAAELEKSGRALGQEFPKESAPWQMLLTAAQYASSEKALAIYKEVAAGSSDPDTQQAAASKLKQLDALNKPVTLAFKAVDGRAIDLANMKGKVVLIDFWATWCGPCIAELPNVKKAYDELHSQGFEIIGVSFDDDCDALAKFVAKNKMAWPQFCDGGGWKNAINKDFGINAIPAMYLVDKKGILRDMSARENLAAKVRDLLKE